MSCCRTKEFLKELDYCKSQIQVWGFSTDICQIVWHLKYQVKEFFPMNGVPQSIVDSLDILLERFKIAEDQLSITAERIIQEVNKIDGLEK